MSIKQLGAVASRQSGDGHAVLEGGRI